ncbi:MAG: hypothetical protein IKN07_08165, partial [Lachnospiraceae bacterium]|nr:hypothetical protein [Lachnospiraceae bacterium]
ILWGAAAAAGALGFTACRNKPETVYGPPTYFNPDPSENVPEAEKNGFAFVYRMCLNLMHNDPVYIHEAAVLFHRPIKETPKTLGNMLITEPFGGSREYVALKNSFLKSIGRSAVW